MEKVWQSGCNNSGVIFLYEKTGRIAAFTAGSGGGNRFTPGH
jgi:hypothetical protein